MLKRDCKYCLGTGQGPELFIKEYRSPCSVCQGKGFNLFNCSEEELIECRCCEGTGRLAHNMLNVFFKECDTCNGTGYINLGAISLYEIQDFWKLFDERIVNVVKQRFDNKQYADSVEAAFKELNSVIKTIVRQKTNQEYDGSSLMDKAFSLKNPIIFLGDLSTESGKNIQLGFAQIFAGSMTVIRNPKAHGNIIIDKEMAIHYLFLANLLMSKVPK